MKPFAKQSPSRATVAIATPWALPPQPRGLRDRTCGTLRWRPSNALRPGRPNAVDDRMVAVRVPDETADKLDKLARKLDRSRAYSAAQAIEAFVARQAWRLAEIEAGLADAERGDFASEVDLAPDSQTNKLLRDNSCRPATLARSTIPRAARERTATHRRLYPKFQPMQLTQCAFQHDELHNLACSLSR